MPSRRLKRPPTRIEGAWLVTLIVEDGEGLADAESYITVAAADARHTAFGNTAWTGTEAAKEAALRRATAYMRQVYRQRWQGRRINDDQALDWPRYDVRVDGYSVDTDTVPAEVANACADLALRTIAGRDLYADQDRAVMREKVGPLETEYDRTSPQAKRYPAIDAMLAPYFMGGGVTVRVLRA